MTIYYPDWRAQKRLLEPWGQPHAVPVASLVT